MIFQASTGVSVTLPASSVASEQAATSRIFQSVAAGSPPTELSREGLEGDCAEIKPPPQDVLEEFDWNNRKVKKEFIQFEQKVLARKANPDEVRRYYSMKRDRNSKIFAERYVRDYAEVQRLKKLSEKLTEIQKYLRPISF